MKGCETGANGGSDRPRASRKESGKERKQGRGGVGVGGGGAAVVWLRRSQYLLHSSDPVPGLMKALNMGPGEGGERRELRRS